MTLPISPYLVSHLELADTLPAQLPDIPEVVVRNIQERLRKLVQLVARGDEQVRQLQLNVDELTALARCPGYRRSDYGAVPTCKYCGLPESKHSISKLLWVGNETEAAK